ncbi:hypothetical protein [Bradyrhizobium sp. NBAIM01]|uniref:hypothetical protein n=1 Tax=Bradyrhizobium sp. NBAIM01 TaxID=2793818 RepID=UPI001CD2356E|nr:hypothetical protein [Bradyrhizobium sp. NBAIM01]MCA1512167.1 hypothetical protein [Bradyrhizobium sp. NBAIM01]
MKPRLVSSREQLLQVVRDRRDALNLSHETIDAITGLQSGYVSKLLSDPPMRGFGEMSLQAVLDALALRIAVCVIVEDEELAKRVRGRWKPRLRSPRPKKRAATECVAGGHIIMMDGGATNVTEVDDGKHEDDRCAGQT